MKPISPSDLRDISVDRRQSGRHPTSKNGRIVFGIPPFAACLILNVSDGGARLELDPDQELPTSFYLHVFEDDHVAWVTVVWRSLEHVGVQFAEPLRSRREHPEAYVRGLTID